MKLDGIYFFGRKNEIPVLEKMIEDLPEGTWYHPSNNRVNSQIKAQLLTERNIEISQINWKEPLAVRTPVKAEANNQYVSFEYKDHFYRIWYLQKED